MRRYMDISVCKKAAASISAIAIAALFTFPAGAFEGGTRHIEPEYSRTLDLAVLSLETTTEDLSLHTGVIESLPAYSKIMILMPDVRYQAIRNEFDGMELGQRAALVRFRTEPARRVRAYLLASGESKLKRKVIRKAHLPRGSVWAQDLFEPVRTKGGGYALLAPYLHKWFMMERIDDKNEVHMDNVFLDELSTVGLGVERGHAVFKGGNVLVDELEGRSIAFVGRDVISDTIAVFSKTEGVKHGEDEVRQELARYLGVDELAVIGGKKPQPTKMFHLDQAMVLFPGRVAGVTRVKGRVGKADVREVAEFLDGLRAKLGELGYRIVDIEATPEDVLNYRYYVNGVPYINSETGKREYLMPLFESSLEGEGSEMFERNRAAIEALGYRVVPIPTDANERQGGIHCILNVIR